MEQPTISFQGNPACLILKTIALESAWQLPGYCAIASARFSKDGACNESGALYPALNRPWNSRAGIEASGAESENNRRAKY